MCGRYSLALRPSNVRQYLQNENLPVDDCPPDEDEEAEEQDSNNRSSRQTYNFAPGYYGLVYRAAVPSYGAGPAPQEKNSSSGGEGAVQEQKERNEVVYKLQSMKWGLIPFWTKRAPDYGSMLKTINCRSDSLAAPGGLWTTMKARKRCVVLCQGFYEWLTKNGHKTPHYIKRADGKLMAFAGLWDCVRYEGVEEELWTYTIVTTDSNKQLSWLHDRMPVILEKEDIQRWLDPHAHEWNKELQELCRPFQGELECYPVSGEVGKVGNNSKSFIVPLDSKENKNNIANFFAKGKTGTGVKKDEIGVKKEKDETKTEIKIEKDNRETVNVQRSEDNAPVPVPKEEAHGIKREHSEDPEEKIKARRFSGDDAGIKADDIKSPMKVATPVKPKTTVSSRKSRSATSNGTPSPSKLDPKTKGTQKITSFFGKG